MDATKTTQTLRTFRMIALLGGLLLMIGLALRLTGLLLITATYVMTMAGGVLLLIGLIGLLTLRLAQPK